MSAFDADFQRILDEELHHYSGQVLELLSASMRAKGLVLTEDLLKSLQAETVAASERHVAQMRVLFNQYGRIKEMKNVAYQKGPPIEELEAFVRKRGVNHFQYVPGYKPGQFPLAQSVAVNRIAWGISRARVREGVGPKPRAWFAKTFYRSLNRFIDAVTTRYAAQTGQHIAATLNF